LFFLLGVKKSLEWILRKSTRILTHIRNLYHFKSKILKRIYGYLFYSNINMIFHRCWTFFTRSSMVLGAAFYHKNRLFSMIEL